MIPARLRAFKAMRWLLLAFVPALLGASCTARKLGPPIEHGRNVGATNDVRQPDAGPPGARLVATVGEKAIGPYLAMGESGGLVAYFVTEGQQRAVVTLPIDATGIPSGDARVSANVPVDSGTLVVRSLGHSFVLAWTALTDKGEAVFTQGISDKGLPITPPIEVARTTDDVVWIAIVKTASGAVAMWAEETQHADANVLAVALDASGKPRGVPSHAARGVSGWQALPSSTGAVLAVLRSVDKNPHPPNGPLRGPEPDPELAWVKLDTEGHTSGTVTVVAPRTAKDMDVARADGGYVVSWTDRSRGEPAVAALVVDEDGKVRATKNVTLGRGAGTLTQIAGGSAGALLAWEEAGKKGARRLHLDVVSTKDGGVTMGATIPIQTSTQPEIAATPSGFALLGWTRLCGKTADAVECAAAPFVPSVLALDSRGAISNADALPPADKAVAGFVWNLECTVNGCEALEATAADGKTRVFLAPVLRSASALAVAQKAPPAPDAPEIATIDTIVSGTTIVDIATARIGKDGPFAVVSLGANDNATTLTARTDGAASVLTKGALPIGGVAIAGTDDGAAVAWVGRDANDPQVHVTKIDRSGKKIADVQLTTAKGDASDVAIGADPAGGFLVAWVDSRDGNGEVYAEHLGKDLQKGTEQRITNAPADATDLAMLITSDRAWLAWADPRESPKDGFADIWVNALDLKDAKVIVPESRLLPTAAHSRSPSLCKVDAGIAVAWIEEAAAGADSRSAQSYGAMLAVLDEKGAKKGDATRIKTADDGFATGVWLDPRSVKSVRGLLVRSSTDALSLDAFDGPTTWSLLVLDGPPTLDVPLAFAGDAILFGDDGPGTNDQRLRRAVLRWKK
jgi:hypothetical protein